VSRLNWKVVGLAGVVAVAVFAGSVVLTARPDLFSGAAGDPQCRAATRIAEAVGPLATGEMAPFQTVEPADLTDLPYDGTGEDARTIADLTGRVTLLNLWATWCAPCRVEMPMLADLHETMSGEDFAVVAVSIDDRESGRPEDFLQETNAAALDYHREPTLTLFNSLRAAGLAHGMPTTLLVGPDGCVAGAVHGLAEWDSRDAMRLIRAAIEAS
jgi:thiol-disulfide isomerase/thioredoxin